MKSNITKFLPIIIILFAIVGVLAYVAKNQKPKEKIKPEVISPSQLKSDNPETNEPATLPSTSEVEDSSKEGSSSDSDSASSGSSSDVEPVYTTTKTTICTPVYGMADTCTEHIVVDTGAETTLAYGLSAFSYLLGLFAFVKSKKA